MKSEIKSEVDAVKSEIKSEVDAVQQKIQVLETGIDELGKKMDSMLELIRQR